MRSRLLEIGGPELRYEERGPFFRFGVGEVVEEPTDRAGRVGEVQERASDVVDGAGGATDGIEEGDAWGEDEGAEIGEGEDARSRSVGFGVG